MVFREVLSAELYIETRQEGLAVGMGYTLRRDEKRAERD